MNLRSSNSNRTGRIRHSLMVLCVCSLFAGAVVACGDSPSGPSGPYSDGPHQGGTVTPGDGDGDGVPDGNDLCETPAGEPVGARGCSLEGDRDADGVPDEQDLCDGTPIGAEANLYGCERNAPPVTAPDSDGDGVPDDRDLCAGTAAGAASTDGCAPGQPYDFENPTNPAASEWLTFTVGTGGPWPITLRAEAGIVTPVANGFQVVGTLLVETPLGHVAILEADVLLETASGDPSQLDALDQDALDQIVRLVGTARIPFPELGVLEGIEVLDLAYATVGLDYGANLDHLDAPLQADRQYLFFHMESQLEASLGPVTMAAPGGTSATFVLDPFDPMFFVTGDLFGLGGMGPVKNIGFGISAQGMLVFEPLHTPSVDTGEYGAFDGHVYLRGTVPLKKLPLEITGEGVIDIDPDHDGATPFNDLVPDLRIGINGELDLSVDFLRFFNFGFNLGSATLQARLSDQRSWAYVAGEIAPDVSWLPEFVPVVPTHHITLEGLISDDLMESYLVAEGSYAMDLSNLGAMTGLDLGNLYGMSATISLSATEGIFIQGTARADLPSPIGLDGDVIVEARFNDDIDDWYVSLTGALSIDGVSLSSSASLVITSQGATIEGVVDTALSSIAMIGSITSGGVELHGEASVSVDINALNEVIETFQCGYEYVTNGAICGYEWVTNAAVCGWDTVTSGAICGYEVVTDAALCGLDYVNCGWQTVTSAVECGFTEFCSWLGICEPASCDIWVCDEQPRSCQDFSQPSTCQVPSSCHDPNQPLTCQDLSSPTFCEDRVTVPDFNWGSFDGSISMTLNNSGLGGSVQGSYCPTDGSCVTLLDGYVHVGDPIEACISVPVLGEYCFSF